MIDNTEYWKDIPSDMIIGRNAFPEKELFSQIPLNANILDLGCGTGEISELLAKHDYSVTGIDINIDAINKNRSKTTQVDYFLGDITQPLPFEDKSFDAIVISFVLVSVISLSLREQLISELTRILKTGGIIWVNEGLTSSDYIRRYELSKPFLNNSDKDFFVFKEGTSSALIQTHEQLEQAIKEEKVARIAHHFSIEELEKLFLNYNVIYKKESETMSPNTKSIIKMAILVFKLKTN